MGSFGTILGLNNQDNGANTVFGQAGQVNPVTGQQVTGSVDQAQGGIGQQQAFVNALQAQNGIGNQSSAFNQLQGVANGTGPNPAQAQLAQATGANTANQAALMAGQRGASSNVGLLARQAAMQGAANQQNSIGQAATMQANQSLNALNSLGNLATQQVGQQQNALSGYNNLAQQQQGALMTGLNNQNQNAISNQSQANSANAGLASTNSGQQGKVLGGFLGGAGAALAKGGTVGIDGKIPMMADGGQMAESPVQINVPNSPDQQAANTAQNQTGPRSFVGKSLNGMSNAMKPQQGDDLEQGSNKLGQGAVGGIKSLFSSSAPDLSGIPVMAAAHGGKVPALVSPNEIYLKPKQAQAVAKGKADPKSVGERIPGKASVKGDSLKNDTVKKDLDVGGVVVPRSIANTGDSKKIAAFVAAHTKRLK